MTLGDDDFPRPGLPGLGSLPTATLPDPEPAELPADDDPRPGDPGTGRPIMRAETVADLSDADQRRLLTLREVEARDEAARLEEMLATQPTLPFVPGFLAHPIAGLLLIGTLALLGLFVLAQVSSTLTAIQNLQPAWLQYPAWAALGLLTLALGYSVGRLLLFYARLRSNQQVRLRDLEELASRTHLRWLVHEKKAAARERLEFYLRSYPLADVRGRKALADMGFTPEALARLETVRDDLLDANRYTHADEWFTRFRTDFQSQLDAVADARVTYYARRVALMTAVSPNSLIDTLVTGYTSTALLADLCRVYNLRVGRLGTTVLLARIFFNVYLAGQLNEFEGVASDQLHQLMGEWATSKLFAKVGSKTLAGALNYMLLRRLGLYAVRLLRPVSGE